MLCTQIQRTSTPCFSYILRNATGVKQLTTAGIRRLSSASPAQVGQADSEEGVQSQSGKPRHNVPFAKNLFLGKFEQVRKCD